jgi:hypothetical protein
MASEYGLQICEEKIKGKTRHLCMDLGHSCSAQSQLHVVHSNQDLDRGQASNQRIARWGLLESNTYNKMDRLSTHTKLERGLLERV